jgi:ABC-type transport system involved in multi-copper enzyme maturation permease subunit
MNKLAETNSAPKLAETRPINKLAAFVKLECIAIKPYLKISTILVYTAVSIFVIFASGNIFAGIGVGLMFGTLSVSYPFAIEEKSNMDALYITLALSRRTVVMGRYIFSLLANICAAGFALLLPLVICLLAPGIGLSFGVDGTLAGFAFLVPLFVLVQAAQIPAFFKLGYTKAKIISIVPFIVIMAAVMGFASLAGHLALDLSPALFWLENNVPAVCVFAGLTLALLIYLSYRISLAFYNKRDF